MFFHQLLIPVGASEEKLLVGVKIFKPDAPYNLILIPVGASEEKLLVGVKIFKPDAPYNLMTNDC
ncbi:MAG: hypothetical protein EAZ90_21065 [Oscillatoriales cyanobacterium]|nr:MAG: hypothetical protein EAZ93_25960 [Oscillatoriales cyanobacterium]TAE40203.1 MAG: hypothetical protein EAZ90_21065 [Oscillatoriales cyanobacterium]TAE51922.1 MAG: hypothetical protein EAZ88_16825 [Oscillatoriales cyanobacterium]TAE65347.1 MAG: hypothetical protein EAZ86_24575 [Oscillatoriales cyanobacterium]TAF60356.1 MAG: hypothetical protein EAZ59_26635 [Oscillatoriales cyanobacterium]